MVTKRKLSIKKRLAWMLAFIMGLGQFVSPISVQALGDMTFTSTMMSHLINESEQFLAPGVQESHITLVNKEGLKVENFILEVDLKHPDTDIVTGSYEDGTGYGMTTVRVQAEAAKANGKNVIAGVNADFYDMATGVPLGCFVKDGEEIKPLGRNRGFFGVKKDGTPVLGDYDTYIEHKGNLQEALGADNLLVKDGNAIDYTSSTDKYYIDRHPRTLVGIKPDGKVIFLVSDGRQVPYSAGLTMTEAGELMRDLGCVDAINLDGGGSSTYLAREQGTDYLACKNSPSDGSERTVANSFLIVSNTPSDRVFARATLEPFDQTVTPYSFVDFTAKGMDESGALVALPKEGLSWKLADESYGTIDPETGTFASNGKLGQVEIQLCYEDSNQKLPITTESALQLFPVATSGDYEVMDTTTPGAYIILPGGKVVGSTYLEIAIPDAISFDKEEISLEFDVESNLGFHGTYEGREVILKSGDIFWDIPEGMGYMDSNNIFHTSSEGSTSGIIKATLNGTNLTATIAAKVGQLPVVLYDFEEGVGEWVPGSAGRGEVVTLDAVDYASGEPVRFGDKSLKINFDLTNAQTSTTLGIYAGPEKEKEIPGAPKAIGAWIYATEEAQGYWLRMNIRDKNGTMKSIDFTDSTTGIDWVGWKYAEAPISTEFQGPFKTFPKQMMRMMSLKSGLPGDGGPMTKGEVYVDNVRVVYGASVDDMFNPIINHITINGKQVGEEEIILTNEKVNISTLFTEDFSDKYATGMNYERIHVYVDGKDYTHAEGLYALNKGQNVMSLNGLRLPDGKHRVDIIVQDNFGNEAKKTGYFSINTGEGTKVDVVGGNQEGAVLGGVYTLDVITNNPSDIDKATIEVKLDKDFPIQDIEYYKGVEDIGKTYDEKKGILTLRVKNSNVGIEADKLVSIHLEVPGSTLPADTLDYSVQTADILYNTDKGEHYGASFATEIVSVPIISGYQIEVQDVLVGREGKVRVVDLEGKVVEGARVNVVVDTEVTELGITDVDGIARGMAMTDKVKKMNIYAEKDGQISFQVKLQSLKPLEQRLPSNIVSNAVEDAATSKNISWMSNPLESGTEAIMQIAPTELYTANGESAFVNVEGSFTEAAFTGHTNIEDNGIVRFNKAVASELKPNTQYTYRVGDGINWSETKHFKTTQEDKGVHFAVMGDIQTSNTTNLKAAISAIEKANVPLDFTMQVGDLIDEASKFDQLDAVSMAMSESSFFSSVDMIRVFGNHEYMGDEEASISKAYYNTPLNGPESRKGETYSVDYGNVHVSVISFTQNREVLEEQLNWLRDDIRKTDKTWRILLTHQPVFYTNPDGGNGLFKEMLPPVMDELGIDFVFSGHDHAYGRTAPLKNGEETVGGTTYIVSGSLGEKYYDAVDDGSFVVYNDERKPLYLTGETTATTMTIKALRPDGAKIDQFTVVKQKEQLPVQVTIDNVEVLSGNQVDVNVHFNHLQDVAGGKITIQYDANYLTCTNVSVADELGIYAINNHKPGEVIFAFVNAYGIAVNELIGATLRFEAKTGIEEMVTIPISVSSAEACDEEKVDREVKVTSGTVKIGSNPLPTATEVTFVGEVVVGETLKASYLYDDKDDRPEEGTSFRWLIAEAGEEVYVPIQGEELATLIVKPEYLGKHIKVEVTVRNAMAEGMPAVGDNGRNQTIERGDVFIDGQVNYKDALSVLQYSVEKVELNEQTQVAADVNKDQIINIKDAMMILNKEVK